MSRGAAIAAPPCSLAFYHTSRQIPHLRSTTIIAEIPDPPEILLDTLSISWYLCKCIDTPLS